MIDTGSAKVGDKIICPDGLGVVERVFDQDNVLIKLENGTYARFDLEKCFKPDDPKAEKILAELA